jgi:hypothetical protein
MFEQGGSSGKTLMIDLSLSSDEENLIADTSHDAEFVKKLFANLNRDILGPSGDGMVINLNDSDEEKEASDEKTAGTELTATSAFNPVSTASTIADDTPVGGGQKMIIVMIRCPIRRPAVAIATKVAPMRLRPLR